MTDITAFVALTALLVLYVVLVREARSNFARTPSTTACRCIAAMG